MLAPEPFFEPRGTPFSEYHRIKALGELGHSVDLVTYPIGADVSLPNLRIIRTGGVPFVRRVPIGPSAVKLLLDCRLALTAWRVARRGGYDLVHSHEEAGFFGVWLARRIGVPHVYDMHSSLPQQLSNFHFTLGRWLLPVFQRLERRAIDQSQAVITICQELQDQVAAFGAGERAILIENVMGGQTDEPPTMSGAGVRARWGIAADSPVALYTGTFEAYQGLDLLMEAAAIAGRTHPTLQVLVAGGEPRQVQAATEKARALGAPMVFAGQQPAHEIPAFIDACDILVSPRIAGTNTPLKIYSYLQSGRPILATNLRTHTQVLDDTVARLVTPEPGALAEGLAELLGDPDRRRQLATAAADLARRRYGRQGYLDRTAAAYARLWPVGS
jgi:glycosyltransferase involved in cell wall biosynthesis